MTPEIRPAASDDAAAIAAIHAQAIEERTATFRTDPPTAREVQGWLRAGRRFPVLVHADGARVEGWARIVPYSQADFYLGVGEYVLYVDRGARRRGLGSALLEAICAQAARLGYWKLVGKLFATNAASIAVARACGFRQVGVHLAHGRLDGEWRDVLLVERSLRGGGAP